MNASRGRGRGSRGGTTEPRIPRGGGRGRGGGRSAPRGEPGAWGSPASEELAVQVVAEATSDVVPVEKPKKEKRVRKEKNRNKWGVMEVLEFIRERVKEEGETAFLASNRAPDPTLPPAPEDTCYRSYFFIDMESLKGGISNKYLYQLLYGELLPSVVVIPLIKADLQTLVKRGRMIKPSQKQIKRNKSTTPTTRTTSATTATTTSFVSKCGGCAAKVLEFPPSTPQRLIVSTRMMRRRVERKEVKGEGATTTATTPTTPTTPSALVRVAGETDNERDGGYGFSTEYILGLLSSFVVDELFDNIKELSQKCSEHDPPVVSARRDIFVVAGESDSESNNDYFSYAGVSVAAQLNELVYLRSQMLAEDSWDLHTKLDVQCHYLLVPSNSAKKKKDSQERGTKRGREWKGKEREEGFEETKSETEEENESWRILEGIQLVKAAKKEVEPPQREKRGDRYVPTHTEGNPSTASLDKESKKAVARAEKWLYKNKKSDSLPKTPLGLHESLVAICRLKKTIKPEAASQILRKLGVLDVCSVCGLLSYPSDMPAKVKRIKESDVGTDSTAKAAYRLMVRLAESEREQLPTTLEGLLNRVKTFGFYEVQVDPQIVIAELTRRGVITFVDKRQKGKMTVTQRVVYKWHEEEKEKRRRIEEEERLVAAEMQERLKRQEEERKRQIAEEWERKFKEEQEEKLRQAEEAKRIRLRSPAEPTVKKIETERGNEKGKEENVHESEEEEEGDIFALFDWDDEEEYGHKYQQTNQAKQKEPTLKKGNEKKAEDEEGVYGGGLFDSDDEGTAYPRSQSSHHARRSQQPEEDEEEAGFGGLFGYDDEEGTPSYGHASYQQPSQRLQHVQQEEEDEGVIGGLFGDDDEGTPYPQPQSYAQRSQRPVEDEDEAGFGGLFGDDDEGTSPYIYASYPQPQPSQRPQHAQQEEDEGVVGGGLFGDDDEGIPYPQPQSYAQRSQQPDEGEEEAGFGGLFGDDDEGGTPSYGYASYQQQLPQHAQQQEEDEDGVVGGGLFGDDDEATSYPQSQHGWGGDDYNSYNIHNTTSTWAQPVGVEEQEEAGYIGGLFGNPNDSSIWQGDQEEGGLFW